MRPHCRPSLEFALTSCNRFPHLYRCGHIEGIQQYVGDCEWFFHFRIFIDAATLKESSSFAESRASEGFPHLYRCGHIEGSLTPEQYKRASEFPHLYRCGHIEGIAEAHAFGVEMRFPHLYRCGHIEGVSVLRRNPRVPDFRIFIDAATLKVGR